jgi:hypothetical protein
MPEYVKCYPGQDVYSSNRATVGHPTFNININLSTDIGSGPGVENPSGLRCNGQLPFHGEVSAGSGVDGVEYRLYPAGDNSPRTLGSTEQIVITDYMIVAASGGEVIIAAGPNASGSVLAKGVVSAGGGFALSMESPFYLPIGVTPVAYCSNGRVDSSIVGYILL